MGSYERLLTEKTNYSGSVPLNIMLFADNETDCHQLAEQAAKGELESFWLDVEGTSRDFAGAHDSIAGFEGVKFFRVGN
jgi:hypothetical protein